MDYLGAPKGYINSGPKYMLLFTFHPGNQPAGVSGHCRRLRHFSILPKLGGSVPNIPACRRMRRENSGCLESGTLWFFPIDTVTDLAWMIIVENFHITVNGG
jgi:hypothetical protein